MPTGRIAADLLVRGACELVTMDGAAPSVDDPHGVAPLGLIERGAVASYRGRVVAIGSEGSVEQAVGLEPGATVIDAHGGLIAPGLLDAHTHALFVGDRSGEFAARLRGATYAQIAAAGGGIAASVRSLRQADSTVLEQALRQRLARMRAFGVTCVEVKTGYGLDTPSEVRSLRAIHAVRDAGPSRVVSTFLPLHAVDPELRALPDGRARFLERTLVETLPAALAERPDFVDAYLDSTGFQVGECRPLIERSGLRARLHVGQFADVGGAEFAASIGAASADHLEHVGDAGLDAMARAGTVAMLLPGAAFSLGQHGPDARRFRAHGVEVAVATDCNPGTSFTENLPLMVAFAVRQMGLSIVEGWWSVTRAAARSLGRGELGRLAVGGPADLCVLDLASWQALPYCFGAPLARHVVIDGAPVATAAAPRAT